MLTYRSADLANWSKASAFGFARPGQWIATPVPGQQTHMGAGLWNRGNVLVGLYGMWQDGPAQRPPGAERLWGTHIDLGLVVSNDGIHFREPSPDFKVIARGSEGEWDSIALLQGHAFVNRGDQTMIWYSHWDTAAEFHSMEIGLATLRRDGFGYLSRMFPQNDGHFVTRTLASTGASLDLRINADNVSPDAPLEVELLDHLDRPMPGYSGGAMARVTSPGIEQRIEWPQQRNPRLPAGRRFAVKVRFPDRGDARVYAVSVAA
ncbi:MAG: hypothetical protein U0Q16_01435 [Bryobacteraceae bacterium]